MVWRSTAAARSLRWAAAFVSLGACGPAAGALVSTDGSFGAGTITLDTLTGLRWLDLTESKGYSHTQLLVA